MTRTASPAQQVADPAQPYRCEVDIRSLDTSGREKLNPFALLEGLRADYERYVRTFQKLQNPAIRDWVRLWKIFRAASSFLRMAHASTLLQSCKNSRLIVISRSCETTEARGQGSPFAPKMSLTIEPNRVPGGGSIQNSSMSLASSTCLRRVQGFSAPAATK